MRLAILQTHPVSHSSEVPDELIGRSIQRIEDAATRAHDNGAQFLVTPELFLSGYNITLPQTQDLAQGAESPAILQIAEIATRYELNIAVGLATRSTSAGATRLRNSALLFDASGKQCIRYDKVQLFGDTDRHRFEPGAVLSPVQTVNGVRVALAICFDIEFPELVRQLAQADAQLILVPTANMHPYLSVAQRLVPARAEENGVFIAYANYCGEEAPFRYTGSSCLVGPDGNDIARAGDQPALLIGELDVSHIDLIRGSVDYLAQRRADLYDN